MTKVKLESNEQFLVRILTDYNNRHTPKVEDKLRLTEITTEEGSTMMEKLYKTDKSEDDIFKEVAVFLLEELRRNIIREKLHETFPKDEVYDRIQIMDFLDVNSKLIGSLYQNPLKPTEPPMTDY